MGINLLPEPSRFQQVRRWVLLGLVAALILIDGILAFFWIRTDLLLKEEEMALAEAEKNLRQLQGEYEEKERMVRLAEQYQVLTQWAASRPPFRSDLELLASLLPQRSLITYVELLDEQTYWIRAILPDMAAVATYTYASEQHPDILRVQVLGVKRKEEGFQLEMEATMKRKG